MIVVTGAAGFIGSRLAHALIRENYQKLVLVDDFSVEAKKRNFETLTSANKIHRDQFLPWLNAHAAQVEFVFHLGARTDTSERNQDLLLKLNTTYSKEIFTICTSAQIPLVYASSAATYGRGEQGFSDNESHIHRLKPINSYAISKHLFDRWVLQQERKPFFWVGLKFFNVYGFGEFHKKNMASVVYHAFHQVQKEGKIKLFKSYRADYPDGGQKRDFVYVEDLVKTCLFFMQRRKHSGIYNVGTGQARTFLSLAQAVFTALHKELNVEYIDIPPDITNTYQYYTKADISKLSKHIGNKSFVPLEQGVKDYITLLSKQT